MDIINKVLSSSLVQEGRKKMGRLGMNRGPGVGLGLFRGKRPEGLKGMSD